MTEEAAQSSKAELDDASEFVDIICRPFQPWKYFPSLYLSTLKQQFNTKTLTDPFLRIGYLEHNGGNGIKPTKFGV